MKEEPDIVKELREAERLGLLQSKVQDVYEELKIAEESSEDVSNKTVSFTESVDAIVDVKGLRWDDKTYRNIVEQATIGVMVTWRGRVVFCSRRESELFGYDDPSALIGREFSEFVHKEDLPRLQRLAEWLKKDGTLPYPIAFRGVGADGKELYIEGVVMIFPFEGKKDSLLFFHIDVTEREKREELIRNIETRYRLIAEKTSDLIATTTFSLNPKYTYVSPSHEKIMGYRSEDLIGKPAFDFIHPEDKKRLFHLAKKYIGVKGKRLLTGEEVELVETIEFRAKDKNGNWHYLESTVNVMGNELLFVSRDVTERKKTEEKLRESEERFRDLFENANDLIQSVDIKGRFVYVNKSWLKTLGYTMDEVKDLTVFDILRKDQIPHCMEIIRRVSKGESFGRVETVFVAKDGREIYVEGSVNGRFKDGKFVATRAIFRDVTERKSVEEKYKRLFNASPDLIAEFDEDGNFLVVNPAMAKSLGFSPDELIGKNIYDIVPKKVVDKRAEIARKAFKENKVQMFEDERGGRYFHNILVPIVSPDGKKSIQAIVRDITEQKKSEEKLRESEEKFRLIFQNVNDEIIYVDKHGKIIDVNRRIEDIFGYKPEEVVGKNLSELGWLRAKDLSKLFKLFKEAVKGKTIELTELEVKHKDGWFIHVEVSTRPLKKNGEIVGFLSIVRDVTERKRMENKLKSAYGEMETLLNAAADGIRIVNRDFTVEMLNDTMAELAGVKKEEAVGMRCSEMFGSDVCGTKDCSMVKVLKNGKRIQTRMLRRRRDGKTIPCLHVATPLKDANGNVVGIIEDFRDITELEEAEINLAKAHYRLRHQNERLKRLNNLQKIFLNVTSHELRTPMAAIKGYADLLLLGTLGELNDEQKEALNVIRRNIDRLDNLIKDILDISRLESGTLSIQPIRCDLREIVAEVLATMKFTTETKNIHIESKIDENLPSIYADRDRIKQVLINLLGNAIKFSKIGSRVILSVKKEGDYVIVAVKDFGRGIPKNKQKKIFEPFYQVDSGMDRKFGGVGLGLAITRGIVAAHGGEITVESEVDKGSTFYVKLPVKPSFAKIAKRFSIFHDEKALPEISLRPSHSELEKLLDKLGGNKNCNILN